MASNALVQTRINAGVMEKATRGSGEHGSDDVRPVRVLLTRTANEGMLPLARLVAPCRRLRLVIRERHVEIDPNALDQGLAAQHQRARHRPKPRGVYRHVACEECETPPDHRITVISPRFLLRYHDGAVGEPRNTLGRACRAPAGRAL